MEKNNQKNLTTTIAALATSPHPAAIGMIRISGPQSEEILNKVFKSKVPPFSAPREMIFGSFINPGSNILLDKILAVAMPGPNSFTGEDVCELYIHGNPILAAQVLRVLYTHGAEPAEPGEFSKRAFLNGKVDLIQAEAIGDLISATSEAAIVLAQEQIEGRLSSAIDKIAEPLRDVVAELEAAIDFPEEDISPDVGDSLRKKIEGASQSISKLVSTYKFGHQVKEGFRVLLCGRPNVGKSSILNELLGKKRAIVSPISGTTRDLIEEEASFNGYKFVFCDSAGIRPTDDVVERIGVELAVEKIGWADLVLFVVDATEQESAWQEVVSFLHPRAKQIWMVVNKIDLKPEVVGKIVCDSSICGRNFYISAQTKEGTTYLVEALVDEVSKSKARDGVSETITNERQRNALESANAMLQKGVEGLNSKLPLEIVSLEIRSALKEIEEIVGKTYQEDILGRIFSKFCIGK